MRSASIYTGMLGTLAGGIWVILRRQRPIEVREPQASGLAFGPKSAGAVGTS